MKKLSVCMLACNTGKFIGKAIESVFSQKTNFEFELVICEDKSTDDTLQIAQEYKSKYPGLIKLILNPVNLGMSANYIKAFKNCSSEYIAILDSDDYWCDPYKLQKQVDFLDKNRDYGVVYSDCRVINYTGDEIEWDEINYYRKQFASGNLFFTLLKEAAFIPMLTTCFRKELISPELENADLWFFEDWWLWMRIAIKSKLYFMNEKTSCYRLHPNNITKTRVINKKAVKLYLKKSYNIYYSNVTYFDSFNKIKLIKSERELIFNKLLMLLYRPHGTVIMKLKLLALFVKYYPGIGSFSWSLFKKIRRMTLLSYKN